MESYAWIMYVCGVIMMNYVGLQWKKSLQCRSAKALSPIGTPSGGIRNKCHRRRKMTASSLQTWRRQRYTIYQRPTSPESSLKTLSLACSLYAFRVVNVVRWRGELRGELRGESRRWSTVKASGRISAILSGGLIWKSGEGAGLNRTATTHALVLRSLLRRFLRSFPHRFLRSSLHN